jgi:hypothetical protein
VDIAAWLTGLGLERYEATFRDADVTSDVLPELTEADLEKLGLPRGTRKKLLTSPPQYQVQNASSLPLSFRIFSRVANPRQARVLNSAPGVVCVLKS